MKRRSFLRLLGATALTPIAVQSVAQVFYGPNVIVVDTGTMLTTIGRSYANQLALSMAQTQETVAARVMDRAFNEIWWRYPERSALFEWLDKGAVREPPVDYWECVGHGDT